MKPTIIALIFLCIAFLNSNAEDWQNAARFEGGYTGRFNLSRNGGLVIYSGNIDPFYSSSGEFSSWNNIATGVDISNDYYPVYSADINGNEAIITTDGESYYRRFIIGGNKWENFDLSRISGSLNLVRFYSLRFGQLIAVAGNTDEDATGLYTSADNGSSFTKIIESGIIDDFNIYQDYDSTIYMVNNGILSRLRPGANAWDTLSLDVSMLIPARFVSNKNNLYIYGDKDIYSTNDKGQSWSLVSDSLCAEKFYYVDLVSAGSDGSVFASTSVFDTTTLKWKTGSLFSLASGDTAWSTVLGNPGFTINDIIDVPGKGLFLSNSLGVMHSSDAGKNWSYINKGINGHVTGACTAEGINVNLGTATGDMLHSEESGNNWQTAIESPSQYREFTDMLIANNGDVVALSSEEGVYYSGDKGRSWTKSNLADTLAWKIYKSKNGDFYSASSGYLSRSTDNGRTWSIVANAGKYSISSITEDDGGNLILCLSGTAFIKLDKDFKPSPLELGSDISADMVFYRKPGKFIFVKRDFPSDSEIAYTFFRTSDYGASWDTVEAELKTSISQSLNYEADNDGNFYCTAAYGLFKLPWGGSGFINDLPAEKSVTYVRMQDSVTLVCGTAKGAVYKKISPVSVHEDLALANQAGCLVSPVPASGLATFRFTANESGTVRIQIFNESGLCLLGFPAVISRPGAQAIDFDASRLPSGSYSFIINSGRLHLGGRFCVVR